MSSLQKALKFGRSYRTRRRVRRILSVAARHGVADILGRSFVGRVAGRMRTFFTLGRYKVGKGGTGRRVRELCEELGPTFVKFGQMLSGRPDLLPQEVVVELARLQDRVEPFAFSQVKESIEAELGRPWPEVFSALDPSPLAAASIAQVHRATLLDGSEVVLKVKRPGIDLTIEDDLAVLMALAEYVEDNLDDVGLFQPVRMVEEFGRTLRQELDFRSEVRNLRRFAANFADEHMLKVPTVHESLCTRSIITMEYVEGVKLTECVDWATLPIKTEEFAALGVRLLLRSVFEHRFFHADPHPGNFLVMADGRVCLLDFGMMGTIEPTRMEELLSFFVGLTTGDSEMLVDALLKAGLAPPDLDVRALRRDVDMMLTQFGSVSLQDLPMDQLLWMVAENVFRHRISMPADLLMVGRAMGTMESIARRMNPDFVPLEQMRPMLISLFLRHGIDPSHAAGRWVDAAFSWGEFAQRLPTELSDVLRRVKKGEFTVKTDERQWRRSRQDAVHSTNRMAGSLIAVGGTAVSTYIMVQDIVPVWLPATGLGLSAFIGAWVLVGIWRSGGMA